jgi:ribosomal protein S18 acetylase RimI-like enzyme
MLRFRTARADDVPAIVALVESAYRGESSRAGWTTEADLLDGQRTDLEQVAALIADPKGRIVLAIKDDAIVGTAHLAQADGCAWFGMFAVRPAFQRGGVGHALLAECERIVREEWRLRCLRMSVIWTRAELIDWYRRRGYAPTGETKPFPYGEPRFGLPKRDDLYFVVLAKEL